MSSNFETGHFINLSNFEALVHYVSNISHYQPDAPDLHITALQSLLNNTQLATTELINAAAILQQHINNRQQLFAQTKKLATRIMHYLAATSNDHEAIKDVKSHYKYLFAQRPTTKIIVNEDGSTSEKRYSSSRLSYHSIAENFQKMTERLATFPGYAPSDPSIQVATLKGNYAVLHNTNKEIELYYQAVNYARNKRDLLMYQKDNGMVDIAAKIKKQLAFQFGKESEHYQYAAQFTFTKKQLRIQSM